MNVPGPDPDLGLGPGPGPGFQASRLQMQASNDDRGGMMAEWRENEKEK